MPANTRALSTSGTRAQIRIIATDGFIRRSNWKRRSSRFAEDKPYNGRHRWQGHAAPVGYGCELSTLEGSLPGLQDVASFRPFSCWKIISRNFEIVSVLSSRVRVGKGIEMPAL